MGQVVTPDLLLTPVWPANKIFLPEPQCGIDLLNLIYDQSKGQIKGNILLPEGTGLQTEVCFCSEEYRFISGTPNLFREIHPHYTNLFLFLNMP